MDNIWALRFYKTVKFKKGRYIRHPHITRKRVEFEYSDPLRMEPPFEKSVSSECNTNFVMISGQVCREIIDVAPRPSPRGLCYDIENLFTGLVSHSFIVSRWGAKEGSGEQMFPRGGKQPERSEGVRNRGFLKSPDLSRDDAPPHSAFVITYRIFFLSTMVVPCDCHIITPTSSRSDRSLSVGRSGV